MKPLKCGACTTCCQWGSDTAIRPVLTLGEEKLFDNDFHKGSYALKAKSNGDCVYLGNKGCTIYKSRPMQCKSFDCRVLYKQMKQSTFIKVILAGKRKLK
jgi:Fe-S-cluster containining protein